MTVPELETMRESLRDLMVFIKDGGKKKHNIDIQDEIFESDFQPDATMIDIRTYREKGHRLFGRALGQYCN